MNVVLVRTMLSWNPLTWITPIIRKVNKTYYDRCAIVQRVEGKMIIFEKKKAIDHNDWKHKDNPMRILKINKAIKDGVVNLTPKNLEKYL